MRQEVRNRAGNTAIALKWGRAFDQEASLQNIGHYQLLPMKQINKKN